MVAVGGYSGCEVSIVTYYKPSGVFLVSLSIGVLSELKMVTPLFVKIAEQLESHSCPIENEAGFFEIRICLGLCGC